MPRVPLLEALRALVPGASNRTLRQMLKQGRVRVNRQVVRNPAQPVGAGDRVEVAPRAAAQREVEGIRIVFEDDDLVIISKPPGLLTVATPHERESTAYGYLREHLRRRHPRAQLHTVHRLDRFASGLLVFAKRAEIREKLKDRFARHDIERRYWAIVEGDVTESEGTIRSRLAEDATLRVRSVERGGKPAVTHFRVLLRRRGLTALEVRLETGRKNQIRVHLSESGHPIAGDRAYGSSTDPLGRLGLHAYLLGFRHPRTGKPLRFRTEPPPEFVPYLPRGGSAFDQS